MSETAPATAPPPARNKKLIIIAAVVLLLVALGGAAAWLLLAKRSAPLDDEDGEPVAHASQPAPPKTPPTYLPMDNMVVNLADPGGDRFAQIGITLELADAKTAEQVKAYMPSIRSSVLLLVSQRTTDDLLTRDGKEKLAQDVRREVARPLGYTEPQPRARAPRAEQREGADDEDPPPRRRRAAAATAAEDSNPVRQVLFSSFIIQ